MVNGYRRSESRDVNEKYKLIYTASDRENRVLGVAGATPKKGEPIKLMPFIATTLPAFAGIVSDLPFVLKPYGHKLYVHITPSPEETMVLQQRGWRLDAALPEAYHRGVVTQQWSLDIMSENVMRTMRLKQRFLDYVRDGRKTLEVRVGYPNLKSIQPGERIRFLSRTETQVVQVKAVRQYPNFDSMLVVESPEQIVPGLSLPDLARLLHEIYPPLKETLGVVVLEIQAERMSK